jgi:hypothetical protein
VDLTMLLEMAASARPDRVALCCGEERLAAGGAASLARESGAARVALLDESNPALPIALFGASWGPTGAVLSGRRAARADRISC